MESDLAVQRYAVRIPARPIPPLSVVVCGFRILALKAALASVGFERTIGWIRRRVEDIPMDASTPIEHVRRLEAVVAMAAALYPGRARCLEQSLVLYYVLRRRGVPVTYCQGVLPHPFSAHAWIEYLGEVVNDVPDHAEQYTRLPDQLP
ncbi:MAG TPA: lasso peptide biosynthesis B2 protein [Vicinamibacterales bacterium]|jgi:hypothetical protein|nr:lasso peptide biosynthesis B2 protein [Vicinamibacterales bacterium]